MSTPFGWTVGSKWYATCYDCGKIVRVNKPLFGSAHFCLTEEEKIAQRKWRRSLEAQRLATALKTGDLIKRMFDARIAALKEAEKV